jgi:hypothetical protein
VAEPPGDVLLKLTAIAASVDYHHLCRTEPAAAACHPPQLAQRSKSCGRREWSR